MTKNLNLLWAMLLIIGFVFFWDSVVLQRYGPRQTTRDTAPPPAFPAAPDVSSPDAPTSVAPAAPLAERLGPVEETVVLENRDARVTLKSAGGRVSSWMIREREHWVDVVPPNLPPARSPLATYPQIDFAITTAGRDTVVMTGEHPAGLRLVKTLRLLSEPPFHTFSFAVTNTSNRPLLLDTPVGWAGGLDKRVANGATAPRDEKADAEMRAVAFSINEEEVKSWRAGFLFGRVVDEVVTGPLRWIGVDNNHFLAAFIGRENNPISAARISADKKNLPSAWMLWDGLLQPGETLERDVLLYVGPKKLSLLHSLGHELAASVDFGFFGPVARLLLRMLEYFYSVTGNYGWSIIILTIIFQIVVFPLTKKSLSHSLRMRELQPQLKKLQQQFKSDPKRLQIETFNLYRKNGMKFMGMEGCVPVVVQIPVFIAFYTTLRVAYELRGAPWIFWIQDLASRDPLFILPILMGAGMMAQQKLTMAAADPAQARMMMFMPVIFTFIFLSLPAGLVLYWFMNSLLTILIQFLLKLHRERRAAPA